MHVWDEWVESIDSTNGREGGMKNYRELEVWERAMDMVVAVYNLTSEFPPRERYGLTSQMQRAAVSVPTNIAEGYGCVHRGNYLHDLSIARSSLAELETHITLAVRLNFAAREKATSVWNMTREVGKMLSSMIRTLQGKPKETTVSGNDCA
jgi:four helix bundle protein